MNDDRRPAYGPVDVVVGASAIAAGVAAVLARRARPVLRPVVRVALDPPLMPVWLRPVQWFDWLGEHGVAMRTAYQPRAAREFDALVMAVTAEVLKRVDPAPLIDKLDLVALTEEILDAVDLPAIIRESTGTMASETVEGARMQGIAADEAVGRLSDRLFRRRSAPDAPRSADAPLTPEG